MNNITKNNMDKKLILGTGISGLIGTRITSLLEKKYSFENCSLDSGVDITNRVQVEEKIQQTQAKIILHMAAKADVDGCEKDKSQGTESAAWKINVEGTRNIAEVAKRNNMKILYISTDFVFDGEKEFYTEEDAPNPINYYAKTKFEGEEIVKNSGLPYCIIRLAYPYRANFALKKDFVRAILDKLKNKQQIQAVTDHFMAPTFIDDIAVGIDAIISKDATGIFHVVGSQFVSPYEASLLIAQTFNLDLALIAKTTREEFFKGKAPRPFQLRLKNDRITQLGVHMLRLEEGLKKLKEQGVS